MIRFVSTIGLAFAATAALASQGSQPPLDLKSTVALALANNPAAASARLAADASAARVVEAKSARGLNVSAVSNYGYLTKATTFAGIPIVDKNTITDGLVIQKLLYSGGKVEAAIGQARNGQAAANEGALAARDAVTASAAEAYYRARMAREGVDVAKESVNAVQASYDAAVKLKDAGVVTKADVLRAEVELDSAKERLLASENGYRNTLAALKTAAGLDQKAEINLADAPNDPGAFDFAKIEPKERHEVSGMRAAAAASESGVRAARNMDRPQVFFQTDLQSIAKGAFFPRQKNTGLFGLAVKMPIWDSGNSRAALAEAEATAAKSREDLRGAEQSTQLEVESARLDFEDAKARQEATATRAASAEESFRVLQAGYKEGISPLTDVLSAQSALVAARFGRIATNYDVQIAQVRLLAAMGRADILQQ